MRLLVHQAVICDVLHAVVELVDHRESIGHLKALDILVGYALEYLEYTSQAVLVGDDDHALILHYTLGDYIVPKGSHTLDTVLH